MIVKNDCKGRELFSRLFLFFLSQKKINIDDYKEPICYNMFRNKEIRLLKGGIRYG